ncbi:hypothetical protein QBC41DRAFT_396583 [Cercophora samala]|uniref:Uncharacterized protein n=1 Tax=Cercophora samala TaxID=330535 RepID=A0AA40D8G7_9PEZI|nr:hypothetical protein QBC41DRAFT_396583 [Cercophora samala]
MASTSSRPQGGISLWDHRLWTPNKSSLDIPPDLSDRLKDTQLEDGEDDGEEDDAGDSVLDENIKSHPDDKWLKYIDAPHSCDLCGKVVVREDQLPGNAFGRGGLCTKECGKTKFVYRWPRFRFDDEDSPAGDALLPLPEALNHTRVASDWAYSKAKTWWMQDCTLHHASCRLKPSSFVPTRLLDVAAIYDNRIGLVESKTVSNIENPARWAALSYQAQIYQYSTVTINAASSGSVHQGFLQDRPIYFYEDTVHPVQITFQPSNSSTNPNWSWASTDSQVSIEVVRGDEEGVVFHGAVVKAEAELAMPKARFTAVKSASLMMRGRVHRAGLRG